jgi:hypothetical protein
MIVDVYHESTNAFYPGISRHNIKIKHIAADGTRLRTQKISPTRNPTFMDPIPKTTVIKASFF